MSGNTEARCAQCLSPRSPTEVAYIGERAYCNHDAPPGYQNCYQYALRTDEQDIAVAANRDGRE